MNPSDTVEYNSLNWVKKELDLVLDDAQKAFNAYIDDASETDKLQECIDQIHLIHGTLLMVELYGAAMLAEEIEELLKIGKIQGGSLDSAIVIKGDKILSKEPLRFEDEFVRHKILDIVGDFSLLGKSLKAHIIAVRPGHSLNSQLVSKIIETSAGKKGKASVGTSPRKSYVLPDETELDIRRVLDVLPHRFPFVLIDRVISMDGETSLTALKNVSVNEPFFPGHFPGHPVMPGVLQLEAMAQAAGILLLKKGSAEGKVAFFMSADKVKFRKPVVPGDQLIIEAVLDKVRGNKLATAKVECKVGEKVVSSASLMFSIVDGGDGA